ncbi:transposase [Streptomyces sp. NPDC002012]|uniref:transposase n=1 Tax=Streptomyces sp. NPDC002012 TaxID=3154532 RepID=UPI0033342300
MQRLQFFLSESTWDHEQVNARRVELLLADPATAPHPGGVLVIDDSGDRKDGRRLRTSDGSGWADWARPTTAS